VLFYIIKPRDPTVGETFVLFAETETEIWSWWKIQNQRWLGSGILLMDPTCLVEEELDQMLVVKLSDNEAVIPIDVQTSLGTLAMKLKPFIPEQVANTTFSPLFATGVTDIDFKKPLLTHACGAIACDSSHHESIPCFGLTNTKTCKWSLKINDLRVPDLNLPENARVSVQSRYLAEIFVGSEVLNHLHCTPNMYDLEDAMEEATRKIKEEGGTWEVAGWWKAGKKQGDVEVQGTQFHITSVRLLTPVPRGMKKYNGDQDDNVAMVANPPTQIRLTQRPIESANRSENTARGDLFGNYSNDESDVNHGYSPSETNRSDTRHSRRHHSQSPNRSRSPLNHSQQTDGPDTDAHDASNTNNLVDDDTSANRSDEINED
jgi:hypothetical protein